MTKNKLLLLLALLMTAATGAWGMQIYISYPSWPTGTNVNGDGNLVLEMEASDSFENMKAKIGDKSGLNPDYMKLYFNSVEMANNETLNAKGVTSNSVLTLVYTLYNVTMKDGVKDADKWTVKVGEGQAQALPVGGLSEGNAVTLTYGGRLKVKSVTATTDAKPAANPNAYLKWDATKKELVEAEIPATATKVANADADVTWAAGTYVVEGDVEINGKITLNGDVNLIIKDGAKLTANQITSANNNLSIYGQANQTGELVVNCDADDAIYGMPTLEVHSANVTATSSQYNCGGIYRISTFNVYGGSVDAENTTGSGYGIGLNDNGSMNIYGGDVKAVGDGTGNAYPFGIRCGTDGATVTVYGGKLWAENVDNAALRNTITLQKGAGFTGKIETSDDGSSWTEYTASGTPGTKYVRVGY